jgi:hypothetical protein
MMQDVLKKMVLSTLRVFVFWSVAVCVLAALFSLIVYAFVSVAWWAGVLAIAVSITFLCVITERFFE